MITGKVYLVGAGPGDPGLITTKGLKAISAADVIIYDNLLDRQLLEEAPLKAERIFAGKTASCHVKEQDEINRLLIDQALAGKIVVRLKGGDPFVLGRGSEEAEVLKKNNIPFEIIPGVTSAIAAPAYAGIPVTHRGIASSFAIITGHEDPRKEKSSICWEQLALGVDTLIFLMGMQNLAAIVTKLEEGGRPSDTPIAVIEKGTKPEQKVVTGTFKDILEKVKEHHISPPAVIVVGDVVVLRDLIRWYDNRPLFGKRILITRSRKQASTLSQLLSQHGAIPVELPVIDIRCVDDKSKLDSVIINLDCYQWIIFTSVNGVESFFSRLKSIGKDTRALHGLKIGGIGPATCQALAQAGITPDYCPEVFTTEGILSGLKSKRISGQRFLLPRSDIADKRLYEGLKEMGVIVDDVAAYTARPVTDSGERIKEMLLSDGIDLITFTSSSTVNNLLAAIGGEKSIPDKVIIACIGPKTAQTASHAGLKVDILARQSTIKSLVEAIEEYFEKEKV